MIARDSLVRFVKSTRLQGVVRIVLIVAIVVVGWRVARSYVALFSEWRQLARPPVTMQSSASQLDSMAAVLPLAGQWSFSELDCSFRTQLITGEEVDACFKSMADLPVAGSGDQFPDVDEKLADLIEKFQLKPVERDGSRIYNLNRAEVKAQLVVRTVDGRDRTVAFAVAYSQSDGRWQLVDFSPHSTTANQGATTDHLLPLPAEARRSGGRFADDGQILLELISLNSNADAITAKWKDAGWEVRSSGMGGPDEFSYLCARGDEVIYAWSADPLDTLQNLMLVRAPKSKDTSP
jgi:hypothetical protein